MTNTAIDSADPRSAPDDELIAWYRATLANLVDVLRSAPLDVEAFTFLSAPTPRGAALSFTSTMPAPARLIAAVVDICERRDG